MLKELYVYRINKSKTLEFVGIIENFSSIIWHEKFYDKGEFQITAHLTQKNLSLIKTDYYYFRYDPQSIKEQTFMQIKEVKIESKEDTGDVITATGVSGSEFLERRIVWNITKFVNKDVCYVLNTLVAENAGSYSAEHKENILDFGRAEENRTLWIYFLKKDYFDLGTSITLQVTGKNLLEIVKQLCKENSLGFKLNHIERLSSQKTDEEGTGHITSSHVFSFKILKPTDRSNYIIFSDDYDNINSATYIKNVVNRKNVVLLAAEGEGAARKRFTFTDNIESANFERFEAYVDIRDSDKEELTDKEYEESLKIEATKQFSTIEEAFETELFTDGVFKFNRDFFLGDYVTIKKFGLEIKAQVIENIESIDLNGYINTPIFAY